MPLPHKPTDGSDGRVELLAVPSPVMIMNVHVITVSFIPGSEIALSWSPMRLEIQSWRPEFHSWSPASDL